MKPDVHEIEREFVLRLEDMDEALALGRPVNFPDGPNFPDELKNRLARAQACLQLLDAAWPRTETVDARDAYATLPPPQDRDKLLHAPERIGAYEVLKELGRGGMGVVYLARMPQSEKLAAVKVIKAGDFARPHELHRFRTEVETIAQLRHPNIVQILESGEADGQPYYSMEYVDGGNLSELLEGRAQPARLAAELVEKLARAMQHAHERGVVHRDLKPANVLLTAATPQTSSGVADTICSASTPKVADFGLAKQLVGDGKQTNTGVILGTASYMAPEQAIGRVRQIGPATDIYAIGAILYEMLTGQPPFKGESQLETLEQVKTMEVVPPRTIRADVPADLETICLRCLEKEPARRYRSAEDLADSLADWLQNKPVESRVRHWARRSRRFIRARAAWLAAAAVLLTLSAGALGVTAWKNWPLYTIQRELKSERRIELLGPTGPPRWFQWRLGSGTVQRLEYPLSISAGPLTMLDLLPDVGSDAYRIRVELKNSQRQDTCAGLYFGCSERKGREGAEQWFCGLGYEISTSGKVCRARVQAIRHRPRTEDRGEFSHYIPTSISTDLPKNFDATAWHTLILEVRKDQVRAFMDDTPLKQDTFARINQWYDRVAASLQRADPAYHSLPAAFSPRGAVGLYVQDGQLIYRNAVVEILD